MSSTANHEEIMAEIAEYRKQIAECIKEAEEYSKESRSSHFRYVATYIEDFLLVEIARQPNLLTLPEKEVKAISNHFNDLRDRIIRENYYDDLHQENDGNCIYCGLLAPKSEIETADKVRDAIRSGSFWRGATEEDKKEEELHIHSFNSFLGMLQRLKGTNTEDMKELIPDAFKVESKIDLDAIDLTRR